tara:strand:- start:573 stop:731 length:159 start_codon:yes stop_codon:yes gene_type:complete
LFINREIGEGRGEGNVYLLISRMTGARRFTAEFENPANIFTSEIEDKETETE